MTAIVVAAIALVVFTVLGVNRSHANDATASEIAAARSSAEAAAASSSAAAPAAETATLTALPPAGAPVLFFGDSYTEGYGAQPESAGYAYLTAAEFGWDATIDSEGRSGYTVEGLEGNTFGQRAADLPDVDAQFVVLQGGLNDQNNRPTAAGIATAAGDVISALQGQYPYAQVVVLGPIPITAEPLQEMRTVDRGLRDAATAAGVVYISPIAEGWDITGYLIADQAHPSTEGHRYIADQFLASLEALTAD